MVGSLKDDIKQLKKFKDEYKKCNVVTEKEAKEAETLAKTIKYFRYDLRCGFDALEEEILQMKCDADPIHATKLKDYAVNKDVRAILKDVEWNQDKLLDAYKKLEKLEKDADIDASTKKLRKLDSTIALDTKLRKGGKPEPMVAKLQKQIVADLKIMDNYYAGIKKSLPDHPKMPDPVKQFNNKASYILNAKPKMKTKTKKFNDLRAKGILQDTKIEKNLKACKDSQKAMDKLIGEALSKAKAGDSEGGIHSWQEGQNKFNFIKVKVKMYTDIKTKYKNEIKNLNDPKKIVKNKIKELEKILADCKKRSDDALVAINRAK